MFEFFATIELASHAALVDAYNCGEQRRECGGVIYHERRGYFYSVPVRGRAFGVMLPLDKPAPAGADAVADYHSHICSVHNRPFADLFSFGDVTANTAFHVVGYMLSGCTGNIHRFDPSQDDRDDIEVDLVSGKKFYLTSGHISGWVDIFN